MAPAQYRRPGGWIIEMNLRNKERRDGLVADEWRDTEERDLER